MTLRSRNFLYLTSKKKKKFSCNCGMLGAGVRGKVLYTGTAVT